MLRVVPYSVRLIKPDAVCAVQRINVSCEDNVTAHWKQVHELHKVWRRLMALHFIGFYGYVPCLAINHVQAKINAYFPV
jgi:hypothetical protein